MTAGQAAENGASGSSESVCVAVHIRPLIDLELTESCAPCLDVPDGTPQVCAGPNNFVYDHVFGGGGQEPGILYQCCVSPLVDGLFQGYNATVFAYGQTGSGKTFTMGSSFPQEPMSLGIIPKVMDSIFTRISNTSSSEFCVRVSFVEIYGEDINDLMLPANMRKQGTVHIRELPSGGICLAGANEKEVKSREEMLNILELGTLSRVTAETGMNKRSSRSHAVFSITVEQRKIDTAAKAAKEAAAAAKEKDENSGEESSSDDEAEEDLDSYLCAKMHLVDLAGSERAKRTKASGQRLQEGININKGLLALGNVINALVEQKNHVPYRDSKLTRMLQDSLGGNSRTLMIACVSPADINLEETVNTLRYAARARAIKNKPVVNRDPVAAQIAFLRQQVAAYKAENAELRQRLGLGGTEVVTLKSREDNTTALVTALGEAQDRLTKLETDHAGVKMQFEVASKELTDCTERMLNAQLQRDKLLRYVQANGGADAAETLASLGVPDDQETLAEQQEQRIRSLQMEVKRLQSLSRVSGAYVFQTRRLMESSASSPMAGSDAGSPFNMPAAMLSPVATLPRSMGSGEMSPDFGLSPRLHMGSEHELELAHSEAFHTGEMQKVQVQLDALQRELEAKEAAAAAVANHAALRHSYENQLKQLANERDTLAKERSDLMSKLRNLEAVAAEERAAVERKYRDRLRELDHRVKAAAAKERKMLEIEAMRQKALDAVKNLEKDITNIKSQKITLVKQMDRANKDFTAWRREKDKELMQLKRVGLANAAQLSRMEALHAKQQEVLRRKTEEAAAARKRLKQMEEDKKKRLVRAPSSGAPPPAPRAAPNRSHSAGSRQTTTPASAQPETSPSFAAGPEDDGSSLAAVLNDETARREWIERELDAACASHEIRKVLEGEKAMRTDAARQLREVERRLAALKNPMWWPGVAGKSGILDQDALEKKKAKLEKAVAQHSNSIQELQLQLVKTRAEEEERGAGAADPRRWAGIPGGAAAKNLALTVFKAASQHKAASYETQLQLTEVTEEVEMLRLRLEVVMQEKMEAERLAAEAQAAVVALNVPGGAPAQQHLPAIAEGPEPASLVPEKRGIPAKTKPRTPAGATMAAAAAEVGRNKTPSPVPQLQTAAVVSGRKTTNFAAAATTSNDASTKSTSTTTASRRKPGESVTHRDPSKPITQDSLEASLQQLLAQLEGLPKDFSNLQSQPSNANTTSTQSAKTPAGPGRAPSTLSESTYPPVPAQQTPSIVPLAAAAQNQKYATDGKYADEEEEEEDFDEEEETESDEDDADAWDPSQATPYVESEEVKRQQRRRPHSGTSPREEDSVVLAAVNEARALQGETPVEKLTVAVLRAQLAGKVINGAEWRGAGKKKADLLQDYHMYLAEQQHKAPLNMSSPASPSSAGSKNRRFDQFRSFLSPSTKRKDSTGSNSPSAGAQIKGLFRRPSSTSPQSPRTNNNNSGAAGMDSLQQQYQELAAQLPPLRSTASMPHNKPGRYEMSPGSSGGGPPPAMSQSEGAAANAAAASSGNGVARGNNNNPTPTSQQPAADVNGAELDELTPPDSLDIDWDEANQYHTEVMYLAHGGHPPPPDDKAYIIPPMRASAKGGDGAQNQPKATGGNVFSRAARAASNFAHRQPSASREAEKAAKEKEKEDKKNKRAWIPS